MMQVDISNIWGALSLRDLLGLEQAIFDAHRTVAAAPEDYGLTTERLEQDFRLYSFENPAWLYTAARKLLFRLGKNKEQIEYCGSAKGTLSRGCELLPMESGAEGHFITLICGGLSEEAVAAQAEQLAAGSCPVISLCPDTTEQLRAFFRFSAALWSNLP
ncbi:MAG: hypothetical protein IKK72_04240 [Oscillospiraceae bacterium]|nr:hypothetical protein [Oscillospiraceae bacterium]